MTQNGEGLNATSAQAQQPAPTPPTGQRPNIVFILVDNIGWGDIRGVRRNDTNSAHRQVGQRGHSLQQLQRRGPVHAVALGHPYRAASGSLGNLHRSLSRAGASWASAVGIHHRRTALRRRLCHRVVRQVAPGRHQGRLPNDQGFDEWWGIKNSWDEAGYTAWPLFKESGMPVPMIWEGKKGEPSKPVMPFDLKVRPIVDGKYIIPKTVELHQAQRSGEEAILRLRWLLRDAPAGDRPTRILPASPLSAAGCSPTSSARWTTASVRSWMPSRKRASTTTPSSSSAATTGAADLSHNSGEVRTGLGAAIS